MALLNGFSRNAGEVFDGVDTVAIFSPCVAIKGKAEVEADEPKVLNRGVWGRKGELELELEDEGSEERDVEAESDGDVVDEGSDRCDGEGNGSVADVGGYPRAWRTRCTSEGEGMRELRYRATGVMSWVEREQKCRLRANDASIPESALSAR